MKYSKIEFWVATALFIAFVAFNLYLFSLVYDEGVRQGQSGLHFFFTFKLPDICAGTAVYAAFISLNYVLQKFWFTKNYNPAIKWTILVFAATGLVFTVEQSYTRDWIYDHYSGKIVANIMLLSRGFSKAAFFMFFYTVYVLLRELIFFKKAIPYYKQGVTATVVREVVIAVIAWFVVFILLVNIPGFFRVIGPFYVIVFPFCLVMYFLNLYWLIPNYKNAPSINASNYILALMATSLVAGFLEVMFLLTSRLYLSFQGTLLFFWFIPLLLTVGLSWWVYLANQEKYKQLTHLKTALGASNANLQFLRSQINPHFLFNALNTLYGTALTEQAEKTGEGIQKLGDMMRFMLHENHLDMIPLTREMEYLHNYIDLQNLRMALSDHIEVKTDITSQYNRLNIAPMLLIPFIENAYKHGISFKQRSWINISLQLAGNCLQLDVYNSLHPEKENDPEKQRSGIGLENVKQRLQLLYPKRHELVIRQNPGEFFIHLTIQLL